MTAPWKQYQEEAAAFFRSIGMDAETDVTVRGVRTEHDIDVLVKSKHVGFEAMWIVECKRWGKPVNKLHVLGLREIVHDVGADKGIMLSESGFQPGAHEAATLTSIQLTSLRKLQETSRQDVFAMRFRDLFDRLAKCEYEYWRYPKEFRKDVGLRPDLAEDGYSSTTVMMVAKEILQEAMRGKYPISFADFTEYIARNRRRLDNHEQAFIAIDQLLTGLEDKLVAAEAEWLSRKG